LATQFIDLFLFLFSFYKRRLIFNNLKPNTSTQSFMNDLISYGNHQRSFQQRIAKHELGDEEEEDINVGETSDDDRVSERSSSPLQLPPSKRQKIEPISPMPQQPLAHHFPLPNQPILSPFFLHNPHFNHFRPHHHNQIEVPILSQPVKTTKKCDISKIESLIETRSTEPELHVKINETKSSSSESSLKNDLLNSSYSSSASSFSSTSCPTSPSKNPSQTQYSIPNQTQSNLNPNLLWYLYALTTRQNGMNFNPNDFTSMVQAYTQNTITQNQLNREEKSIVAEQKHEIDDVNREQAIEQNTNNSNSTISEQEESTEDDSNETHKELN
jgi:hypothetical protein